MQSHPKKRPALRRSLVALGVNVDQVCVHLASAPVKRFFRDDSVDDKGH
jgi:hypothetical protein